MIRMTLAFLFSVGVSQAATIESAVFQKATQQLELVVVYQGGLKSHDFSLVWDSCRQLNGKNQVSARMIDSGWDDTGRKELSQLVSFDLSTISCKPAELTIFSDRYSRATLWID